jgi:hypothetical protein
MISTEIIILAVIMFMVAIAFALFSPLGIFFIIFSIIRLKTKSIQLRKASFVLQIILALITFIAGLILSVLLFLFGPNSYYYISSESIIMGLSFIFGIFLAVGIEIVVIIWESIYLNKNKKSVSNKKQIKK